MKNLKRIKSAYLCITWHVTIGLDSWDFACQTHKHKKWIARKKVVVCRSITINNIMQNAWGLGRKKALEGLKWGKRCLRKSKMMSKGAIYET